MRTDPKNVRQSGEDRKRPAHGQSDAIGAFRYAVGGLRFGYEVTTAIKDWRSMNTGNYVQKFYFSVAATVAILLGAGLFVFESLPPRTIVMATGAEGGANYELGIRYREILAREGVELQLQPTTGSLENLRRLRDSKSGVSVGFTQGGTTTTKESPELESLGTIFYEPLWLFRRAEIGEGAQGLRGRRLSIGPEGSGGGGVWA